MEYGEDSGLVLHFRLQRYVLSDWHDNLSLIEPRASGSKPSN
jgi:hypothetical protein